MNIPAFLPAPTARRRPSATETLQQLLDEAHSAPPMPYEAVPKERVLDLMKLAAQQRPRSANKLYAKHIDLTA